MRYLPYAVVVCVLLVVLFVSLSSSTEDTAAAGSADVVRVVVPVVRAVRVESVRTEYVVIDNTPDPRVEVYYGMLGLATTEHPYHLDRLVRRWGQRPNYSWDVAGLIVTYANEFNLDPFDLLAMAWQESRFNPSVHGDCWQNRCISCGIVQINTRFKRGRPTCRQALIPRVSLRWAAARLDSLRDPKQDNRLILYRYNGGLSYEIKVRRTAELARWHARARLRFRAELRSMWLKGSSELEGHFRSFVSGSSSQV